MSVTDRIKEQLTSKPVVLYMKGSPDFPQCGFSAKTVEVLNACSAEFGHFNVLADPEIREGLKEYSNWPTFPQLYINGQLVGGCDIVIDLYNQGELQKMITTA